MWLLSGDRQSTDPARITCILLYSFLVSISVLLLLFSHQHIQTKLNTVFKISLLHFTTIVVAFGGVCPSSDVLNDYITKKFAGIIELFHCFLD